MFNIGPLELVVLAIVGLVVLGPERLPGLARDAARMLRTLREMATGAREQLRDELGPEFADVDLRNLNPRTAVQKAIFGDEMPDFTKYDPRRLNPSSMMRDAIFGEAPSADVPAEADAPNEPAAQRPTEPGVQLSKPAAPATTRRAATPPAATQPEAPAADPARPRPRPRPGPGRRYDSDAT